MTTIQSLPQELLLAIFSCLDTLEEAGNCRLVCKAWESPAAIAMLGKPIQIYNHARTDKLIQYLTMHPDRGRHVRHLIVIKYQKNNIEKLLKLTFTPNMEELGGVGDEFLYNLLIKIAIQFPKKFDKLTKIPASYDLNEGYCNALLTFRESLTEVDLCSRDKTTLQRVIHRFDIFDSLNNLAVEQDFNNLQDLEAALKYSFRFKSVGFTINGFLDWEDQLDDGMDTAQLMSWATENVQRVDSVKALYVSAIGYPSFIEYLLYKYLNTESFTLVTFEVVNAYDMFDDLVNFHIVRIINAIKHLKYYNLDYRIPFGDDFNAVCKAAQGDRNTLKLGYPYIWTEDVMAVQLQCTKLDDGTRRTEFSLEIPTIASNYHHVKMIADAGIPLYRLELDFVNYSLPQNDRYYRQQLRIDEQSSVFFDTLCDFPEIREIKLTANRIEADSEHFSFHDQVMLESLEICNAEVTELAFEVAAYHCPNLKEFKLLNCQLVPDSSKVFHIWMNNISYDRFIFKTAPISYMLPELKDTCDNEHNIEDFERVLDEVKQTWSKVFYLWLDIVQAGKKLYYKITPRANTTKLITTNAFESRSKKSLVIHMSCFNIKSLLIHIGQSMLSLDEETIHADLKSRRVYALEWKGQGHDDMNEGATHAGMQY